MPQEPVVVVGGEGVSEKYQGIYRPVAPHGKYVHYENENGMHLYNAWEAGNQRQWCLRGKFTPKESEADAFFEQCDTELKTGPQRVLCSRTTFLDQRYYRAQGVPETVTIVGAVGAESVTSNGEVVATPHYESHARVVNGEYKLREDNINGRPAFNKLGDAKVLWYCDGEWWIGGEGDHFGTKWGWGYMVSSVSSPDLQKPDTDVFKVFDGRSGADDKWHKQPTIRAMVSHEVVISLATCELDAAVHHRRSVAGRYRVVEDDDDDLCF
eukprot:COSAG02_NODE_254_length_26937_cov_16.503950_29_plen_268_part_00